MKNIYLLLSFLFLIQIGFAQEDSVVVEEVVVEEAPAPVNLNVPVREPWGSGYLIDNQTSYIPAPNTLEAVIQHRFGSMDNGTSDLFGIYAPGANLRLAFNYTIVKNLQIGYGLTKKNMYSDFNVKYTVFEQTRSNSRPVAVTLYANMAIDGRHERVFLPNYSNENRFSYFGQIIFGRKINDMFSVQAAMSFSHYNKVAIDMDHDKLAAHFSGRCRISPQTSFFLSYDAPINLKAITEQHGFGTAALPNLAFGAEISTSTHAFQIFMGTANGLLPQDNIVYNKSDFMTNGLQIGFVITRLWNF